MVQKIHPQGVIWGAFFPSHSSIFFKKKSGECFVHPYISPWLN